MKIVCHEAVSLTEEERRHLNAALNLILNIYDEATDSKICDIADKASDAITELLDYCQS